MKGSTRQRPGFFVDLGRPKAATKSLWPQATPRHEGNIMRAFLRAFVSLWHVWGFGLSKTGATMKNKYRWTAAIVSAVLVLDQITKYLVEKHIRMYETVTVIPGFFNLTHVRNRGAAFSLLAGAPAAFRIVFFITITLIALAVIIVLIRKTHERLLVVAFSLIAGGAIGNNLIDRIRYGEVVDFINLYIWEKFNFLNPWPTFNIADSAISVGVALLAIDMFFNKPRDTVKQV
jgi:signal peptidase II